MIQRKDLASYLEDFLKTAQYNDYAPNGIQIEGKESIKRIATAVTASEEVISKAVAWQADALLVHHGYFWRGEDPVITGMKRERIAKILNHDMNLFAYHLPLDCHRELGNNACLAKLFSFQSIRTHKVANVPDLLWSAELREPLSADKFAQLIATKLGRAPLHISGTDKMIHTLAWCSGGAQDYIQDASHLGVDAYLSGEVSERTYYQAKELGIHYYSCGHHATERYGIQALGEFLANKFDLEYFFIDSDNPV